MCVGKSDHEVAAVKKNRAKSPELEDSLSQITQITKIVLFKIGDFFDIAQKCPFYRVISRTTQPAHLITLIAVTWIAFLYYPKEVKTDHSKSLLIAFCYLACYGIHLGSQVWMTFVSGLSLYFSLPRHTFGSVQKVLFPKYFLTNSVLSFFTLMAFVKTNNSAFGDFYMRVQGYSLTVCFVLELLIRLYLTPPLIGLISEKIAMESRQGVGSEVGKQELKNLVKCPHYLRIHKKFRKIHMGIAIGNMLTMACSVFHLHYLALKICTSI